MLRHWRALDERVEVAKLGRFLLFFPWAIFIRIPTRPNTSLRGILRQSTNIRFAHLINEWKFKLDWPICLFHLLFLFYTKCQYFTICNLIDLILYFNLLFLIYKNKKFIIIKWIVMSVANLRRRHNRRWRVSFRGWCLRFGEWPCVWSPFIFIC